MFVEPTLTTFYSSYPSILRLLSTIALKEACRLRSVRTARGTFEWNYDLVKIFG